MYHCQQLKILCLAILIPAFQGKIDWIDLEDDQRELVHLVSFGMYNGAYLSVNLSVRLDITTVNNYTEAFGLTIDRTQQSSSQVARYGESRSDSTLGCLAAQTKTKAIAMKFIIKNKTDGSMFVNKTNEMVRLKVTSTVKRKELMTTSTVKPESHTVHKSRKKRDDNTKKQKNPEVTTSELETTTEDSSGKLNQTSTPSASADDSGYVEVPSGVMKGSLPISVSLDGNILSFNVSFNLTVVDENDAGLYSIFFHNCLTSTDKQIASIKRLLVLITGRNTNPLSYLGAGDIPEPYLFFVLSVVYIVLSFVWLRILRKATSGVFKTHYLMLAVCYCKALAALFHGTNFYYIGRQGREETAWAVIYYISYLMKTIMLFLTIMLVGTGWTFIKHVFSDKEKKLFLVVIPLQVLVYIAHVIMGETEEATKAYSTWRTISIAVDLVCCVGIMLPVIWSIRHLTEASHTDGKAAINLRKLRLFRSLYVMVISYIYITRIVVLVFQVTLPFQYYWLGDFFNEVTVLLFVSTLGYKFRPADDNPYFQIPPDSDDEEEQIELAVTQSGLTTETKRRNLTVNADSGDVEKRSLLGSKGSRSNESSHELD